MLKRDKQISTYRKLKMTSGSQEVRGSIPLVSTEHEGTAVHRSAFRRF